MLPSKLRVFFPIPPNQTLNKLNLSENEFHVSHPFPLTTSVTSQDKGGNLTAGTTSVAQDSSSHNSRKQSTSGEPPDSNMENESDSNFSDESPRKAKEGVKQSE